jgi:hypothetical protein
VGDDLAYSYIAIRSDEHRTGYISTKPNIIPVYPFRDDGIDREGVGKILTDAGIGLPDYYRWRTRSGCYFCFFQRKHEWVRLFDEHPDLFAKAVEYEDKVRYESTASDRQFTWSQGETLRELIARRDEIEAEHEVRLGRQEKQRANRPLFEILSAALDDDDDTLGCFACHL